MNGHRQEIIGAKSSAETVLNAPWTNVQSALTFSSKNRSFQRLEFHLATKPSTSFQSSSINSTSLAKSKQLIKDPTSAIELPYPGLFDTSFLSFEWKTVLKVGPGLHNYGNTCYLNSTLQCLLYTPVLSQLFLDERAESAALAHMNNQRQPSISTIYKKLVEDVWKPINRGNPSNISPRMMVQNIRRVGKQFRNHRQEDAHEYLVQLLDCMHEEVIQAHRLNSNKENIRLKETTFISRIFGGYLCNSLTCPQCSYSSRTYNYYQQLSLDIFSGIGSVKAAIHAFTKPEILSRGNEWHCDRCNQRVRATKQMVISSLSPVLILHLKRFHPLGGKNNKHIDVDVTLSLPCMATGSTAIYDLYAMVVHHGSSVHSGHYVAFVKAPSGQWHEMNDSVVKVASLQQILSKQAYILFYRRRSTVNLSGSLAPVASVQVTATVAVKETIVEPQVDKPCRLALIESWRIRPMRYRINLQFSNPSSATFRFNGRNTFLRWRSSRKRKIREVVAEKSSDSRDHEAIDDDDDDVDETEDNASDRKDRCEGKSSLAKAVDGHPGEVTRNGRVMNKSLQSIMNRSNYDVFDKQRGWLDDEEDEDSGIVVHQFKEAIKRQIEGEQVFLSSRQASEWDKLLDQGRTKKIKVKGPDDSRINHQRNPFQDIQNKLFNKKT